MTRFHLDRIDHEIIRLLQEDARRSNKELAAAVGIAQSTCSERMRRLDELGVFAGFHATVSPSAIGIGLEAIIAVRMRRHGAGEIDSFRSRAMGTSEVVAVFHVSGATDFLVHVVVADADHLRDLVVSTFSTWPEVGHIETSLVFERVSKAAMPDLADPGTTRAGRRGGAP